MGDDEPTLGERMNRGMGLDPGFTLDKPSLVDTLRDDIDATTKRAQANLDQQRQNQADIEELSKEIEAEKGLPPGPEPED